MLIPRIYMVCAVTAAAVFAAHKARLVSVNSVPAAIGTTAIAAQAPHSQSIGERLTNPAAVNSGAADAKLFRINEYKDHPYKLIDKAKAPRFQGIGILQRERELVEDAKALAKNPQAVQTAGHGTGINIGPCAVLTNRHVQFGSDVSLHEMGYYRMIYTIGPSPTVKFAQTSTLTPEVIGDLVKSDFSISKDMKCSGALYGWYEPSTIPSDELVRTHARVVVVSFPGYEGLGLMAAGFGNVTGINEDNGNVLYDASTLPGSSGGAVFIISSAGKLLLQGVHVGGAKTRDGLAEYPKYSAAYANEFVNVSEIMYRKDVNNFLNHDRASHPGQNPLEPFLQVAP